MKTIVLAGALSLALVTQAAAQMPSAEECAAGAAPVTLGRHVGSATACVSAGGHVVAYAGGNAIIPCGTVVVADQTVTATDANVCDSLLDLPPDRLEYDVVLPAGYAADPDRRYPVLYLLSASVADDWPRDEAHLQELADQGVIIVLPPQGFGFYTDWADGSHDFDRLYADELVRDVDTRYRTIGDRAHRALAGFSKAGYGAMLFAARHPDRFAVAASISGLLDIGRPGFPQQFSAQMAAGFATYDDPSHPLANRIWGDPVEDEIGWHARNPTDLVTNLRGLDLFESAGDGVATPEEVAAAPTSVDPSQEAEIRLQSDNFDRALTAAGIPHTDVRRRGSHTYLAAVSQLHAWAPQMFAAFSHPAASPAAFDYRSADSSFSVLGWTVTADPGRAREFLDLTAASAAGVTVAGSGRTEIVTGPYFRRNERVLIDGVRTRADKEGRLHVTVDLGAPHTDQAYTTAARAKERVPGYVVTKRVSFARPG